MKQVTRTIAAATRAAAEREARPLMKAFARAGYLLAEELWLRGTAPAGQDGRLTVVRVGEGGTLRLVFTHDDNGAAIPIVATGLTLRTLPGLRGAIVLLTLLVVIGIMVLTGTPSAQ